jgi:hypothetical protein
MPLVRFVRGCGVSRVSSVSRVSIHIERDKKQTDLFVSNNYWK